MKYKVTAQYAKEEENPIAEFSKLNDAMIFVKAKSFLDEKQTIKLIYRIFDQNNLLHEINKEKIKVPIAKALYAEEILSLPETFSIPMIVYQNSADKKRMIAKFINLEDAKLFITAKIASETDKKNEYLIFYKNKFIQKLNKTILDSEKSQSTGSQEKKVSFRPTPLNTTLRPAPRHWLIDEDEEDDEKEK